MGVFRVPVEIGGLDGTRFERIEALVDTDASYYHTTCFCTPWLGDCSLTERFPLTRWLTAALREYELGQAMVRVDGVSAPTIVVFGEEEHARPAS